MADYIVEIVIMIMFLYEGIVLLVKKNGGIGSRRGQYTEESLAKYSKIAGVIFLAFAVYEVFILLNKMNVINVLDSLGDNSVARNLITIAPIFVVIAIILILHFTILKKDEGYTAP
ncbi:MAG: hypothetical protein J6X94_13600, partial [Lachnospiraceae bacterium]|nr:hypothetical protein [Lachnospiraceae bacterium]